MCSYLHFWSHIEAVIAAGEGFIELVNKYIFHLVLKFQKYMHSVQRYSLFSILSLWQVIYHMHPVWKIFL